MTAVANDHRSGLAGGFVPALEGMRGLAAVGVLLTHVAFQTGSTSIPVIGPLLGRLDMAVALFFGLTGFLLWRPYASAARGTRSRPRTRKYLLHRAVRILPAYWVVVVVVLTLLPGAGGSVRVWLANLSLVQVFVPLTLTEGMTQMWSLSVEVAFYLLLPFLGIAMASMSGDRARRRVPLIIAVSALSLGWTFLPISTEPGVNIENWLPGYLPWFGAGMVIAEAAAAATIRTTDDAPVLMRIASRRWRMVAVAGVAFAVSATPLAGSHDLTTPAAWQFATKVALGAIIAFCLIAPLVLGAGVRTRWLAGPFALTIGRWSYGIFIWHLAVLAVVFPVLGIGPFDGQFLVVAGTTLVLTLPIAAASYALVEEPVRGALKRREGRRPAVVEREGRRPAVVEREGIAARATAARESNAAN